MVVTWKRAIHDDLVWQACLHVFERLLVLLHRDESPSALVHTKGRGKVLAEMVLDDVHESD